MKCLTMGMFRAATATVPDETPILLSTEGFYALAQEIQVNTPPHRFKKDWPDRLKFEAVCVEAD